MAFPVEFERLASAFDALKAQRATEEEARELGFNAMQRFIDEHRQYFNTAPTFEFRRLMEEELALVAALSQDSVRVCAKYVTAGRLDPSYRPNLATRAVQARYGPVMIRAVRSGRDTPVIRSSPTDSDYEAYGSALRAQQLDERLISAMAEEKTADLSYADQCAAGHAAVAAFLAIDAEAAARLYAAGDGT